MRILSLMLFCQTIIYAQYPANLFPYHIGDKWQYWTNDDHYWTRQIIKDSIDTEKSHHIIFEATSANASSNWYQYYIIDTLNQVWEITNDPNVGLYLRYKLEADSGAWYQCGNNILGPFYAKVKKTGLTYIFGQQKRFKEYIFYSSETPGTNPFDDMEWSNAVIVEDMGWIYSWYEGYSEESLVAAVIDSAYFGNFVGIDKLSNPQVIDEFSLSDPFPNPFNSQIHFSIKLPTIEHISIKIYSISGQLIKTLFSGTKRSGLHEFHWDSKNDTGELCSSGIYIIRAQSQNQYISRKILLTK